MMSDYQSISALGPFFAVSEHRGEPGWRPFGDLLAPGGLDERVDHVRASLTRLAGSEVERRVAASTLSLGVFARLLAPQVGAAALGRGAPPPRPSAWWWQPVDSGPLPLATPRTPEPPDLDGVLADLIGPLVRILADEHGVSETIGWGNAGSALFGAVTMVRAARPDRADRALALAASLLDRSPLAGAGEWGPQFRRRSCCLYYRVPGGGFCGDCVLVNRDDS